MTGPSLKLLRALRIVARASRPLGLPATNEKLYTYQDVLDSAAEASNPDIEEAKFGGTFSMDQKFAIRKVPLKLVYTGCGSKDEDPSQVMWCEQGPEYEDGELVGGDEFYAQNFAKKHPSGDSAEPIIVMPKSGKFEILDGRHRARAAYIRGETTIRAFVPVVTHE